MFLLCEEQQWFLGRGACDRKSVLPLPIWQGSKRRSRPCLHALSSPLPPLLPLFHVSFSSPLAFFLLHMLVVTRPSQLDELESKRPSECLRIRYSESSDHHNVIVNVNRMLSMMSCFEEVCMSWFLVSLIVHAYMVAQVRVHLCFILNLIGYCSL